MGLEVPKTESGWTVASPPYYFFPAHAGMDRRNLVLDRHNLVVPRPRGDVLKGRALARLFHARAAKNLLDDGVVRAMVKRVDRLWMCGIFSHVVPISWHDKVVIRNEIRRFVLRSPEVIRSYWVDARPSGLPSLWPSAGGHEPLTHPQTSFNGTHPSTNRAPCRVACLPQLPFLSNICYNSPSAQSRSSSG